MKTKYFFKSKSFNDKNDFAFCFIPTIFFIKEDNEWNLVLMWLCYGIAISNYKD